MIFRPLRFKSVRICFFGSLTSVPSRPARQILHISTKAKGGRRAKEVDVELELKNAADRLGISNLEGWYSIRTRDIDQIASIGLKTLQKRHLRSLSSLLKSSFPNHEWQDWRFTQPPRTFFEDLSAQRAAFAWLSTQLGLRSNDGWYLIKKQDLKSFPGIVKLIKTNYGDSLAEALLVLQPDHAWDSQQFVWDLSIGSSDGIPTPVPWRKFQVRKQFFDEFSSKTLRISDLTSSDELSKWYSVTNRMVDEAGAGHALRSLYGGSLVRALREVYPHHQWLPWRFSATGRGFWHDIENRKEFLSWAAAELGIDHVDQRKWLSITTKQLAALGGSGLLETYSNSVPALLKSTYPDVDWSSVGFDY